MWHTKGCCVKERLALQKLIELPGFDLLNSSFSSGKAKCRHQLDNRPCWIKLTPTYAEFRTVLISVMVVVQSFAGGDERDEADVGGGVIEVLVPDVVAETVNRR